MEVLRGYVRADGTVGFRNHLLVMPLSGCMSRIAERIAGSVDGAVAVPHAIGCGQVGRDMDLLALQLECFARHPNVGGVVFVRMRCEGMRPYRIPDKVAATGRVVEELDYHKIGGTTKTVGRGVQVAQKMLRKLASTERGPVPFSSLIVGTKCGSSDSDSYRYANPALGLACDRLVDEGATVVLSEDWELIGAVEDLAARAVNARVARTIRAVIRRVGQQARVLGYDYDAEMAAVPNGREKQRVGSLQRVAKAGTKPIQSVFSLGEQIHGPGLVILDAPNNDNDSVAGLAASGCQIIAFTTGMGTPMGCAVAPVVKIASNHTTFRRMRENMDIGAGPEPGGPYDIQRVADRIHDRLLQCANGKLSRAEKAGHTEISLTRYGITF